MKYRLVIMSILLFMHCVRGYAQSLPARYGMPLPVISMETENAGRVGAKAPVINFTDISGKSWEPGDWKNKVLYLYCCNAASAEEPAVWGRMHYLAERYKHFNMLFVVMLADSSQALISQLSKMSSPYIIAVNQQHWLEQLGTGTVATSVVINRKGRINYWQDTAAAGKLAEEVEVLEKLLAK